MNITKGLGPSGNGEYHSSILFHSKYRPGNARTCWWVSYVLCRFILNTAYCSRARLLLRVLAADSEPPSGPVAAGTNGRMHLLLSCYHRWSPTFSNRRNNSTAILDNRNRSEITYSITSQPTYCLLQMPSLSCDIRIAECLINEKEKCCRRQTPVPPEQLQPWWSLDVSFINSLAILIMCSISPKERVVTVSFYRLHSWSNAVEFFAAYRKARPRTSSTSWLTQRG